MKIQDFDVHRRASGVFAAVLLVVGCSGPLPFMSGGALEGNEAAVPSGWALGEDYGMAQLETRPEDPYSVNIAYTIVDQQLYINAGDTETTWVQHMDASPLVRLKIGDAIYALRAERVTDMEEISAFGAVWTSQGFYHRDPSELDEVWLYRFAAR